MEKNPEGWRVTISVLSTLDGYTSSFLPVFWVL
jgi:hypothetical protein